LTAGSNCRGRVVGIPRHWIIRLELQSKQRFARAFDNHVPEPDGLILAATAEVVRQFRLRMPDHKPIWTCLGVAVLGDPGMRVEVRVTAFRK
jgi:enamine deaminase RidA (YjgF/YER057c/UK114 family)